MTKAQFAQQTHVGSLPNGPGVAAVLAAGLGSFAMAVFAIVADHSPAFKKLMIFSTPTGPLSGVTTTGVIVWLLSWVALDVAWRRRDVSTRLITAGLGLLALSFILMFPPIADLF